MDHRDEFQNWCDLWDQAQEEGIFPGEKKAAPAVDAEDLVPEPYHDYLDSEEESMIQEEKKYIANPIRPDTIGKDQESAIAWPTNKLFEKVEEMKKKLYDIECKLNTASAGGHKWTERAVEIGKEDKKLISQIDSIRKQIDTLSDRLGIDQEPDMSMYGIK